MAVWDGWGTWWPPITATSRAEGFRRAWQQHDEIVEALRDVEMIRRPYGREYFLFRAPIHRARAFHRQTPQLWWPDDRAWFVSTEIDDYSTYIGASGPCLEALFASETLEAIAVPYEVPSGGGL
jgi:transposase InsO family protein